MDNCTLCKIANHEIESRIIYEDQYTIGVLDIKPRFAKGQCVVFPKKHVIRVYDLEDEDALCLFRGVKSVARKIESTYNPESVSIFVRGRTFPHAHVILFPAFPVDQDMFSQFLKPMILYNPLNQITDAELDEIAATLRAS
jgi:histidine triad (HIT) family protein